MNPYSILSQIGAINAQRATLVKQDGRRIELLVKPESGVSETVGGQTTTRRAAKIKKTAFYFRYASKSARN